MKIKESEKERQVLGNCLRTKKDVYYESDGEPNCNWRSWNGPRMLVKKTDRVGNRCKNQDYQIYSIVEIGQNAKKRPGELRRFAVTQNPLKAHQLTPVKKIFKGSVLEINIHKLQ